MSLATATGHHYSTACLLCTHMHTNLESAWRRGAALNWDKERDTGSERGVEGGRAREGKSEGGERERERERGSGGGG